MGIVVFGASGQIGRALINQIKDTKVTALTSREANFLYPQNLARILDSHKPFAVINCAAYTNVPKAETEEDIAIKINGEAPAEIAKWCAERNIPFITYSTDYVFGDKHAGPLTEDVSPHPLNAYGRSKLIGEESVQKAGGKYLILRTSWVYDERGKNFVTTMLQVGKEKEELNIVCDQFGAPTYASDIATATRLALKSMATKNISGVFHVSNSGVTNWCDFAKSIFNIAKKAGFSLKVRNIKPINAADYPSQVIRPLNSRLNCDRFYQEFNHRLRPWETALKQCLGNLIESH